MTAGRSLELIAGARPIIGMEVHVELATRTKAFTRAHNIAHAAHFDAAPNSLTDPLVLALPGTLPVLNRAAVELALAVGLALGCEIPEWCVWDRKSYFYPDLPKAYQISQYERPLCGAGCVEIPAIDEKGRFDLEAPGARVRIARAHLEEDAGKLLHEAPGGGPIDCSIVDLNRAGTPLLEIVTEPDLTGASWCVSFARLLRMACRDLGATEGVLQRGHMRFEPNINLELSLRDGRTVRTPIVEVKNLNSLRALREAVEHEIRAQPARWTEDGREAGAGTKQTRGWDGDRGITIPQRGKEDAHDYRYFPDPDLAVVRVDRAWAELVRARVGEFPTARMRRYVRECGVASADAQALAEEPSLHGFFEAVAASATGLGVAATEAWRLGAILTLQCAMKRANERGVSIGDLGVSASACGRLAVLRAEGAIGAGAMDEIFGVMCEGEGDDPRAIAERRGLLVVRDEGALAAWCRRVIEEQADVAAQVRAGRAQAVGRLVGAVMKLSGGAADAAKVRTRLMEMLGGG